MYLHSNRVCCNFGLPPLFLVIGLRNPFAIITQEFFEALGIASACPCFQALPGGSYLRITDSYPYESRENR